MSELLLNWLNNEVGLSTNVANFEKDFSNGYLFGEVLHKFRQQDDFDHFDNRSTYEAKLANFKRIEPTLKALGIKVNATQSNAMMNGERGSALRLLYQLKMATERLMMASDTGMPQPKSGGAPAGSSVTKGIRVPRDQFDNHERRFFEHRLRATCPNPKHEHLQKVTKRYEQEMDKQEVVAYEMDRLEQAHIAEQREIHRFGLRERMRQNKVAKDDWIRNSVQHWEQNMNVKATRENFEVSFQKRVHRQKLEKLHNARETASLEVQSGIDAFEGTLTTMGAMRLKEDRGPLPPDEEPEDSDLSDTSENQPKRLLANTTQAGDAREFVAKIQAKMPHSEELEHEAGLFLQKIKEGKRAGSIARKERERRRRRVLVDQQKEQDLFEEGKLEEVLLEKLGREAVEERSISYSVWKTQRYEDVIVQNRRLRQEQYDARQKEDVQEALTRDQALLAEMVQTMREQESREAMRYRAVERGRRAAERATWSEECEGILELVTQMAFAAVQQEQLTDSEEVDEVLWREWMAKFLEGMPVESLEPLRTDGMGPMHPLTNVPPEPYKDAPQLVLDDASLRDYVESTGQWSLAGAGQPYDASEVAKKLVEEAAALSFASRVEGAVEIVGCRPVNYRLGAVAAAILDRKYAQPPLPEPPAMPDVPLKLVMTGKPFAGKKTLAKRLAEAYNLQVIDLDEVVRECLALSKRPDGGDHPMNTLAVMSLTRDDHCKWHEDQGNPYVGHMQALGYELQELLDRGEAIPNEMYVRMLCLKIRALFFDRMPKPEEDAQPDAIADADAAPASGDASPVAADRTSPATAGGDPTFLEPSGWLLTGFPDDAERLQLFERFASGWVQPTAVPTPEAELQKGEAALVALAPPKDPPPFVLTPGGYDLHFRLEVHADEVSRRAVGRRLDPASNLEYHLEDHPPTSKRQIIFERLVPVDGLHNSMGSLTHRIHNFDVSQPDFEFVCSHFGPFPDLQRLMNIDANGTMDEVYDLLDEQIAMLMDRKRQELAEAAALAAEAAAPPPEEAAVEDAPADADGAEDGEAPSAEEAAASRAPSKAAESPDGEAEPPAEEGPIIPAPVQLAELPKFVEKLEGSVFDLLVKQWESLQLDFKASVEKLFVWHRAHLADFRGGLYGISQRFAAFLQRPDDKQALVDAFIQRFNAFSEEYPDMRKQGETKAELHMRAEDLKGELHLCVEENRSKSLEELEAIEKAKWVEAQVTVVAAQAQHAVRLEARRYFAACQLLNDFYFGAMGMPLPPALEAPPKINALGKEEEPPEDPDPKAKAKAKAKAKGKGEPEVEEKPPDPMEKLRKYAEATEDAPAHWQFPFLDDLMTQAERVAVAPQEFSAPVAAEKEEEETAKDPKAKAKAKADPKAKAKGKAKGEEEAPPPPAEPTPALYVDLQEALIAERVTYTHRLAVIKKWTHGRLLVVSDSVVDVFKQCHDWVLLRRVKELDAIEGLVDIIKEHIEADPPPLIGARLTLDGAHLHRHPNVRLQPPEPVVIPPSVETSSPYRWSMSHLNGLLDAVVHASQAYSPDARVLPSRAAYALFTRLTQGPAEMGAKEAWQVPARWQSCGPGRLEELCGLFHRPPSDGVVDCVELLLHVGLLHSPAGWPTLDALLEVRKSLEELKPKDASWPDFWISEEQFAQLPLFADPTGAEEKYAQENKSAAALAPSALPRAREQLLWVGRVLKSFPAPLQQMQCWEVECAWWDHNTRCSDGAERYTEMLDDTKSESHHSVHNSPRDGLTGGLLAGADTAALDQTLSSETGPPAPKPPPPRPEVPEVPAKSAGADISVRQLLAYFCLGGSPQEGIERALAALGPAAGKGNAVPLADLHVALLQFGARPTPPSWEGDGRPAYPSLAELSEELGVDPGGSVQADFVGEARAAALLARFGLGRRHCRAPVEQLFPKSP